VIDRRRFSAAIVKGYLLMVIEIAQFTAQPGKAEELRRGLLAAMPVIQTAEGCHSVRLRRCVEDPSVFIYKIEWETLEHHTVMFRGGPLFGEYRSQINGLFVEPVHVRHYEPAEG
jgi:quinol monooxygenase YgiN